MNTLSDKILRGRQAMQSISNYTQEQVDEMLSVISKTIFDHAEELAKEAVEETGLGNYEHKIGKNQNMAINIFSHLKGKKSVGIIQTLKEEGLVEIAHPVGVIGSVTPTTNPTITPLGNGLMALKGKNAMIVSPHPRAKKTTKHTIDLMRSALESIHAPKDLLQVIEEPSLELSQQLMRESDVIVATGGPGLVRAAYSSGKPAFGVGPGNVQAILDDDFDINLAVELTVIGRSFDNGIVCACQQSLLYPEKKEEELFHALENNKAYIIKEEIDVQKMRELLFPGGKSNPELVGQTATFIAEKAGIKVPEDTVILAVKVTTSGQEELLVKEKMNPVLVVKGCESFEEALLDAKNNLWVEGAGHSTGIFSNNEQHILSAGETLPVSRVVVNQPTIDAGGSPTNGLNPTVSLGCGSWGNNSISENLSYHHLINISRIAYPISPKHTQTPWN